MEPMNKDVLISGAGVAGLVLAYWLRRRGFNPTVVERSPALRQTGGHAVDLFRPACEIAERMGVLPELQARRTRTRRISLVRGPGKAPVHLDLARLSTAISDRHVEIMRDDLTDVLFARSRDAEFLFGDSIQALDVDAGGVTVTFERNARRRFHLVVGADGLHSNVRRLAFGPESRFTRYLGAYLSVFSFPDYLGLGDQLLAYNSVGKVVALYRTGRGEEARAVLLFRSPAQLSYDHRDVEQQKRLLREQFAGERWEVPRLMTEARRARDLYLDSITQVTMKAWSSGRVALVGDAGYSPGPAVGGGTSLAMVGAYVLAEELGATGGDHLPAFKNYEDALRSYVVASGDAGRATVGKLIPRSQWQVWMTEQKTRLAGVLPRSVLRALAQADLKVTRVHDAFRLNPTS
jgi:2-polyprenyl-6-methoxyphenol hydroxylase-like FAD-dependent oxidoreductase